MLGFSDAISSKAIWNFESFKNHHTKIVGNFEFLVFFVSFVCTSSTNWTFFCSYDFTYLKFFFHLATVNPINFKRQKSIIRQNTCVKMIRISLLSRIFCGAQRDFTPIFQKHANLPVKLGERYYIFVVYSTATQS